METTGGWALPPAVVNPNTVLLLAEEDKMTGRKRGVWLAMVVAAVGKRQRRVRGRVFIGEMVAEWGAARLNH